MEAENMNDDWQDNLSNWKQQRKSQSSYQKVLDLDVQEEETRRPRAKTYKEMVEERKHRKGAFESSSFDLGDGSFDFEYSKPRAASSGDLSKTDDTPSHGNTTFENEDTPSHGNTTFNHRDPVDRDSFSEDASTFVEKTEEIIKKVSVPLTHGEPTPTNDTSHSFKDSQLHETHRNKTHPDFDLNIVRDGRKSANFSANRDRFETGKTDSSTAKSSPDGKPRTTGSGTNIADRLKMWNKPTDEVPHSLGTKPAEQKKTSTNDKQKKNTVQSISANMFFEKTIRINQRPNHKKGFGFTISGGRESSSPIVVDKVTRGGSADICELKAGDEIIAINGADVARHYNESVQNVLAQAVTNGTIELKIKRLKDLEEDFEEEDVFSDEELRPVVNAKASRFSGSQSSIWSSPPSTPPALPMVADPSDDLPPPPLPSVPPPPPNWNTFPGDIFSSPNNAAVENITPVPRNDVFPFSSRNPEKASEDMTGNQLKDVPVKNKEDILRRKSEFLGLKLEESQEFKALKEDTEKKSKLGATNNAELMSSFSLSDSRNSLLPLPSPLEDYIPGQKSSFPEFHNAKLGSRSSTFDGSSRNYQLSSDTGQAGWSNGQTSNAHGRVDVTRDEETLGRGNKEQERLKVKEEELRMKEEMIRKEAERLQKEKERMARETEEQLTKERERLQREKELQLKEERARLVREKEEQLRLEQERLHREKDEKLREQNDRRLKLEIERLKKEKDEQIQLEREKLRREKEEEIQQEKEQLQWKKEHQRREMEESIRQEREKQDLRLKNSGGGLSVNRGLRDAETTSRKLSAEPSESEVAEYSVKYGGKTFARLAEHTRSESLGEYGSTKSLPKAESNVSRDGTRDGNFARLISQAETGFSQDFQKPVNNTKLEKADVSTNFSSIRSNFEHGKHSNPEAPNRVMDPAAWKRENTWKRDQIQDDLPRAPTSSSLPSTLKEFSQGSSVPWHERTSSQVGEKAGSLRREAVPSEKPQLAPELRDRTISLGPSSPRGPLAGQGRQVDEKMTSLEPRFGSRDGHGKMPVDDRYVASGDPRIVEQNLPSHGPQISERTTSLRPQQQPQTSEHTTMRGPLFESQDLYENNSADDWYTPGGNVEYSSSPGPPIRERSTSLGHAPREEKNPRTPNEPTSVKPLSGQTKSKPSHSNISYLLYGDADHTETGTNNGGYNSRIHGVTAPNSAGIPPVSESHSWKPENSSDQQDKGFLRKSGDFSMNSNLPTHQFNESWPSPKAGTLPPLRSFTNDDVNQRQTRPPGPRPFEASWKYPSGVGDHWLVEEAERRRIAEQTGQERSWSYFGQEEKPAYGLPRSLPSSRNPEEMTRTLPYCAPSDHSPVHSNGLYGDNSHGKPSHSSDFHLQRSPRSVPEPVKQTLLNRINTGSSGKSPTSLGPLPSYPKNYSNVPSHSRSVSNPAADPLPFQPPSRPVNSSSGPAVSQSHASSGGAVDSLFAYHEAAYPGTNLVSQKSLSRSQGSLHLDGTPQFSDVAAQSRKLHGPYPGHGNSSQYAYPDDGDQRSQSYKIYSTDPGFTFGHSADSFPQYCQPVVNNLLCSVCQRPLTEISGRVTMKDGDLRLRCQNCHQENEVKYSKV